jgi:hypothetical protein
VTLCFMRHIVVADGRSNHLLATRGGSPWTDGGYICRNSCR